MGSTALRPRSGPHPNFNYRPFAKPEEMGMAGESNGYRAALVMRQPTPGLISSLPGTAGLPADYLFFDKLPCIAGDADTKQKSVMRGGALPANRCRDGGEPASGCPL
jgi:hypothetical protein